MEGTPSSLWFSGMSFVCRRAFVPCNFFALGVVFCSVIVVRTVRGFALLTFPPKKEKIPPPDLSSFSASTCSSIPTSTFSFAALLSLGLIKLKKEFPSDGSSCTGSSSLTSLFFSFSVPIEPKLKKEFPLDGSSSCTSSSSLTTFFFSFSVAIEPKLKKEFTPDGSFSCTGSSSSFLTTLFFSFSVPLEPKLKKEFPTDGCSP
mmetsp:Transcript_428/g.1019  ORF Transcript_428/g.1019 Transcript_428/m.1019 type:complete len:203 (+) Transcript_428:822-1430(+)